MDSIIPLRQKNTLAEYMILSGADNCPPMLDKDLYDSWKSQMELYMQNREHGRMILESVENADCDMKATNIILQGLPTDIYSLVNHHRVAKDLWERVQLLMQGTSLTKQERESLINDMNIYNMKMKQFQVNTKFLNSLPPEWSKFVTDVKLVKDLHTTNFDQLHAYLEQHELYANEVCLLRERNQDPLAFMANQHMTLPHFNTYQYSYNNPQLQQQFSPSQYGSIHPTQHYSSTYPSQPQFNHSSVQSSYLYQSQMNHQTSSVPQITYQSPQVSTQPMTESPLVDSGFAVPVFSPGDDPIACLNKAMAFLTVVASSRFPSTNNQLKTSSNPRNQATIQDGRVTVQQVQGRQASDRNVAGIKRKAMLAELRKLDKILDEKILAFSCRSRNLSSREKMIDSQMDDKIKEKIALKEQVDSLEQNLSTQIKEKECLLQTFTVFKSQSAQTVHMLTKPQAFYDNTHKQALGYQNPFHLMKAQRIKPTLYDGIVMSDKHVVMPVIDDEETLILEEESRSKMSEKEKDPEAIKQNISHKPIDYEKLNRLTKDFGKCFTSQQELLAEHAFWLHMSDPTSKPSDVLLVKIEAPKELPKISLVNESLKKLKFHLAKFDNVVKIRTTTNARTEGEWGFEHMKAVFNNEIILFLKSLKDIFNVFDRDLKEKSKEKNVNYDCCEIETKNVELENSVTKLLSENEHLCNEINHVKQVFKEQFDLIKKTCVRSKEQSDSLIDKLNLKSVENKDLKAQIQDKVFVITSLKNDLQKLKGKEIVDIAAQIPSANTIVPGMFKLDLEPLAPRLLQNREIHIEYLKYTQEQADILRGIVEQAKAKQPLDKELDFACKHAQRIQELLVYVQDTCPNAIKLSAKKVAVTPKNNVKKVRFAEPLTSSSNIKQVESSTTSNSNTYVVFPTGIARFETQKPELKVYRRKPKNVKNVGSSKKAKIVESKNANHLEPNHTWGSNATDIPSSSSLVMTRCPDFRFRNEHIARIMRYGDYQLGNVTISRVYYVEGLGHNLFSVGQFCEGDLEVVFQKNTFFIRNLEGVDLLSGSRDTNLYTISLDDMLKTSLIYLLSKASKTKSWLWHRRLSHLNFGTINKLAKDGLARGIPRLKFQKDPLCSACALGKSKKSSHQPKAEDTNQEKLYILHMDLCGPMRVASINEKRYILVIVDVYSRFTWVRFLRTKDEAPEAIIKCIKNIQVCLNATISRTPQQNGIVERRIWTLVEATRTMLVFSKDPLFLWSEAINTACYTKNRSLIRRQYNKTPYKLMQEKKPDLSFFHVFGALCYPTTHNDDLGKLDAKANIGIFVSYAPAKKAFRIYNKRTQKLIKTIHVTFDELTSMAFEQFSLGPELHSMTLATFSSGLVLNPVSQQPCIPPPRDDWDRLFQPMFDEYFTLPSIVVSPVQEAAALRAVVLIDSPVSTSID
ncbi:retrovirus-related pol polyprotein from transposon TNT 1-94 [Tanacetum coccineum]